MKATLTILFALAAAVPVHAGWIGFFTSEARDWHFVENSGGIVLHAPEIRNGKLVLPVDYSPQGHSGLVVRKVELKRKGAVLGLRVFTQLVEKDGTSESRHWIDLSALSPGTYEVHYGKITSPERFLDRIVIPK